ncbi:MAG: DUF2860 family protein [Halieaceae bacterium]|jgi:hypothetical protein|nr:DUF2860 family protein [Halieaceae bacterium]
MNIQMLKASAAALALGVAQQGMALDAMPEPGWGGFVNLGVGTGSVESNFLAKVTGVDVDLSDSRIDEFGSPDDESVTLPMGALNVGYTFDSGKTRIFVGNDLSDFVQFDQATILSVRHDTDSLGRLQAGFIRTAGIATEVYEDPYQLNVDREETERIRTGVRLTWDKILGSQFEIQLTATERELDEERSGEGLGLSDADRALLDREGDLMRAEVGYLWDLGGGHFLRPRVAYIDRDLDGDAMAQDGYEVGASYVYFSPRVRFVGNLFYQQLDGDAVNPIFDEVNDADSLFASASIWFPGAFGWKNWMPRITVAYGEEDSDIDFNDTKASIFSVSLFRTF